MTEIFLGGLARSANRSVKRPFHRERKNNSLAIENVISPSTSLRTGYEATAALSLGILGLKESFVQLNEIMVCKKKDVYLLQ